MRLLTDILMDALTEATTELGQGLDPAAGVEAARRLAHSLVAVKVVLVATYRDAEADRVTDFGATLAHEVRGHLSAALSGVQLVQLLGEKPDGEARQAEALQRIEHALEQASGVVSSVESLSRAASDLPEAWTYRPLSEIAAEIVAEAEPEVETQLRVDDDDSPDVRVPDDPVRLIVHNLVENAIKYANPEEQSRWVRIHWEREADGHLVIHVGDNGLGIPEAEQERIFLRFRRGNGAPGEGFGLGLAIVRETARKIGGRVLLESEPGRGSTFSLSLPAHRVR
jgi:signal transduction histidine kinase